MFSFEKSCEISFQVNGSQEGQICEKDLGLDSELLAAVNMYTACTKPATTTKPSKPTTTHKRKSHVRGGGGGGGGGERDKKKTLHRDTERQRRVAMSGLLNTLYSLLPTQFVKGKRSVTDHIGETINYIKHMQDNIKELAEKRDRLRRTLQANSAHNSPHPSEEDTSFGSVLCDVTIYTRNGSLEIQISGGSREDGGFRLSEPLNVLLEEGLNVVCSVSSKLNGIFIHNIQCQISDNIDVQQLQQKLYEVVCSDRSSSTIYAAGTESSPLDLMEKENQFYSLFNFA